MLIGRVRLFFFFSSRRRHTRYWRDWSSDVCSSDLDDGFQVLFTAYPVLCSYLDLGALDLRYFLPAVRIALTGARRGEAQTSLIGDAVQSPSLLLDTIAARHVSAADKMRLLALRFLATSLSVDDCFS